MLKPNQIGLYALLLAQQKPEGQPEKEGARDHDPLGCGEERPDEELEGGLLKVLEDEDEAAYHGYADSDELGIVSQGLQSHPSLHNNSPQIIACTKLLCQQSCGSLE